MNTFYKKRFRFQQAIPKQPFPQIYISLASEQFHYLEKMLILNKDKHILTFIEKNITIAESSLFYFTLAVPQKELVCILY